MNNIDEALHTIDLEFIKKVEASHFRTNCDTGANENALLVWNCVREHVGLPRLTKEQLPAWCVSHDTYHEIREDYGCKRKEVKT